MEFKDNKDKIKEALLKGGLVVAERGTGKTSALFEILLEQGNAVIIVPTEQQRRRYSDLLQEEFPGIYSKMDLRDTIMLDSSITEKLLLGLNKDVYIDEYHLCKYRGPFKAAVTSFPFELTVIS